MRQQTSHLREIVIEGLMVKITSLMEGRAYWADGKEGHRQHSKQWGEDVQSLLYKYVPAYNASDTLAPSAQRHRGGEDRL